MTEKMAEHKVDFEFMRQYRQLAAEIAELEEERVALSEGKIPAAWPMGERVSGGRQQDITADVVAKMWDLAERMAKKLNVLIEMRIKIENWLDSFAPDERRMLRLYYVDGLSWEAVAEKVGYSSRHLSRIIKRLQAENSQENSQSGAA